MSNRFGVSRCCCTSICGCSCCNKIPTDTVLHDTTINGPFYNPVYHPSTPSDPNTPPPPPVASPIDLNGFQPLFASDIILTDNIEYLRTYCPTYIDSYTPPITFNPITNGDIFYRVESE